MSNRSPKRSILTERKVRRVIREEINTRYGNRLTARQKVMLEQGIIQGVKNALGGIFGVGSAGAKYVAGKVENIGTNISKAVDSVKTTYAAGKLGPATKAFNDLIIKTNAAGEQLAAMYIKANVAVPPELETFNTAAAKKEAEAMPATPAAAGTIAATPAAPATGAVKSKPGMGESKPVAINKGPTSLQSNLFKLAGADAEKKKQIIGVLKALGGDLKTGKIPITEAADLVNLKNTVTALQSITDPGLFKSVKDEIVKILSNVKTKVNIAQVQSARQAKASTKPAAAPATEATAGETPATPATPVAEAAEMSKFSESLRRKRRF